MGDVTRSRSIKKNYIKGTVSRYKRIFSNGSRMGIPNIQLSTWAMWFCDVAITPIYPCARDRACTLALASEIDVASILGDVEQPAYVYFRCVAFLSWAYQPLNGTMGSLDRILWAW